MITYIGSPNFIEGREDKQVKKIILHWIVGTLEAADKVFQDTTRNTSAHFGVGDNDIHQYVDIEDTAYHAGNWNVNLESIGIEHEGGPDLPISDATYKISAKLIAALSLLYDIPLDKAHIIPHKQIVATQCPGTLDVDRLIKESAIIVKPIVQQKLTLQTVIPKELLEGEDQSLEIQQIAGLLLDGKRDNLDLQNAREEIEKLETTASRLTGELIVMTKDLKECLSKPANPSNPTDYSKMELLVMLINKIFFPIKKVGG